MKPTIIWITIPRRYDRVHFFTKWNLLKYPQFNFLRVNGADPIWHHFRSTDNAKTHGQAGCWLSHYFAWQIGLATGQEHLIFMEDDSVILPGFETALSEIYSGPHDLLHLDPTTSNGLHGYYVRRDRLALMVEENSERTAHIDDQVWNKYGRTSFPRQLVRHACDEILSETCEWTWESYHKELLKAGYR